MIYSLNGRVIHTEPNAIVIECGGVGYRCITTANTLNAVLQKNENNKTVMLYTHMIVREDAVELCGFADKSELNCFRLLTSINGIGAKAAVSILSELTPEQLALSVSSGDSKSLTKANGIGNKTAQRIILELKDKIKKILPQGLSDMPANIPSTANTAFSSGGNVSKALSALAVLGYTPDEVMPFMRDVDPELSVEKIIGETLKAIGKK